jgi:hypothetical protein
MLLAAEEIDGSAAHGLGLVQRLERPAVDGAFRWAHDQLRPQ